MTSRIKKILFPFHKKSLPLKKYWWHRLFVVVFFITVIVAALFPLYIDVHAYNVANIGCNEIQFDYAHISKYANPEVGMSLADSLRDVCLEGSSSILNSARKPDLIFGIIFALFISYVLQLIYYKIFIYILFGKDHHQENEKH